MKLVRLFSNMGITKEQAEDSPQVRNALRREVARGMWMVKGVMSAEDVEAVEYQEKASEMTDPNTGEVRRGFVVTAKVLLEKSRFVPANPDGTIDEAARKAALMEMQESFWARFKRIADESSRETVELLQGLTDTMGESAQWGASAAKRFVVHGASASSGETPESRASAQRAFVAENKVRVMLPKPEDD